MQLKSCLRTLGFSATNDIFAENAWYFRNALVRANYTNLQEGIHETTEYLEVFFRNLLLNEKNELHNRNLHISGLLNEEKVDIENEKVDIESVLSEKGSNFSVKTTVHIHDSPQQGGCDLGIYLNPSSIGFKRSLNSEIYVDKTGLIEKNKCPARYRTEIHLCQPSAPFWQVDGGEYAVCILCLRRGFFCAV